MRIRLLGEVAVTPDAAESPPDAVGVTIASPRLQRVLATLVLRPGAVTLDAIADALWDGALPVNWKPALRNAVAKLRRELDGVGAGGDIVVATTPTGYRLGRGHSVDVHTAVADVDSAVDALEAGDADRAFDLAVPAAALLAIGLAPTLDGDWLLPERTRIATAELRGLEVAAAASVMTGRAGEAVRYAELAVERDGLREEAHRQLIAAHLAAGNRGAALRAYEHCRRTLADELGVGPDERTAELHRRALGTEPPRGGRSGLRRDAPFTGRVDELAVLAKRIAPSSVVVIVGPPGIGKSLLADEAATMLRERFDGGRFDVDLEAVGDDSALGAVAGAVGAELPYDAGATAVCAALAARGPVLLVLDGADRCADAIASLAATLTVAAPNVAVVVTARQQIGTPGAHVVRVAGFDPATDGVQCFAAHAERAGIELPAGSDAAAKVVELCRIVDGNPLAIALLARQAGVASLHDLVAGAERDPASTPLASVIQSTVDGLDSSERHVFTRLSVVHGAASLDLVQAVAASSDLPAARVTRILSQLAERGLVQLDRGDVHWRYDLHPTLRVAARSLLGLEAGDAYGRLADALFTMLPTSATLPPPVASIRALLPAVRGYLDAALGGAADVDPALRLAFWLHRYWAADGVDEGIHWLTRLLARAGAGSPHGGLAAFGLGYLLVWVGRPVEASEHLGDSCRALARTDDVMLPAAHYYLAGTYENRQPALAREHFRAAMDAARRHGNAMLATVCAEGLGVVEFEEGHVDAGLARIEESLVARQAIGGDDLLKVGLAEYARMLVSADRLDDADRELRRAERLLGDEARIANITACATRARLARLRGRPAVARRYALRAAEMIASTGVRRLEAIPQITLALLELDAGDAEAAASRLAAAAKSSVESDQPQFLADVLDAATIVACHAGQADQAACLAGATDALRARAHVVRPRPEQRELDAALAGLESPDTTRRRRDGASLDAASLVDLVVELAGTELTVRRVAAG